MSKTLKMDTTYWMDAINKPPPTSPPHPPPLTAETYAVQQDEVLKNIPEELKGTLSYMAYEHGHSAGYDEVLGILKGYVADLEEPLKKFEKRIRQEMLDISDKSGRMLT